MCGRFCSFICILYKRICIVDCAQPSVAGGWKIDQPRVIPQMKHWQVVEVLWTYAVVYNIYPQFDFYGKVSTCIPSLFVPHKSCLKCVQTIFTAAQCGKLTLKHVYSEPNYILMQFHTFYDIFNLFLLDLSQIWAKSGSSHGCHHLDRSLPLTILYLQWPDICLHWNPSNVKIETHFFMSSCLHLEMLS